MRLRRLDLERYGPFTGTSLTFRAGAALHLVYGPNEAGKSSALAALTDLFFGFEARSRANFLHRYDDLRIGAEIETADGDLLAFRRRKGTRNTLIDAAGAGLDEALLEPHLGGVSREVFASAFGLSQQGLREGARGMLAAHGEIGESLFAAASGARGLIGARDRLNEEADLLFAPRRAAKRAFYEAQDRYDEARRDLRERSLRAETLKALAETIEGHEARLIAIKQRLGELAGERARLARLGRVGPILRRIDTIEAEMAVLGSLPATPADFPARVDAALARENACRQALMRLGADAEATRKTIAEADVDETVLAAGDAIAALAEERGAIAKNQADLPRRIAEARSLEDDVADLARRLGRAGREELLHFQPDDLLIERARVLIETRRELQREAAAAGKALTEAGEALAALERAKAASVPAIEVEPLRRRLSALRPSLLEAGTLIERLSLLARQDERLAERGRQLGGEAQALRQRPLPADEAIAAHEARLAALTADEAQARKENERARAALAAAEQDLAARAAAVEALDADVLAAYRHRRDAMLDTLLAAPAPEVVEAYREAVAKADRLADARLERADDVAQRDNARRRLVEAQAQRDRAVSAQADIARARAEAAEAWKALFAPFGLAPGTPGEMRRWLAGVRQLREDRTALETESATAAALSVRLEAERPALEELALAAGLDAPVNRSLATLLREVEERLSLLAASGEEAHKTTLRHEAALASQDKTEAAQAKAEAALAAFEPEWRKLVALLGLDAAAEGAEAARALDLWQSAAAKLPLLASLEHRIATMRDDEDAFARKTASLAAGLVPQPPDAPFAAITALQETLKRQVQAHTRRAAIADRLAAIEVDLAAAAAEAGLAEAALARLAEEGEAPREDLADRAETLRQRARLSALLADARRDLAGQGDGLNEAELREAMQGQDPDDAAARERAIEAEQAGLIDEDKAASLELRDLKRQEAGFETASGAAQAAQRLQDARADLERIARDYLLRKAAALLIGTGVERQVRAQQDPLIERAGALFARITQGAFAGIAVAYDSEDELRLAARRRDGGTVALDGLSEGSCDQLYLSLRLASLEAVAARRPVPPFIGDDLVVTFDEPRVAATLETLATSGAALQVILFTHHRHVVDIARERLGEALDIVSLQKD